MKANQRSPPPRGRLLTALAAGLATGSGMPVESAFTRFFAYVVARIVSEGRKSPPIREMSTQKFGNLENVG